jgi:hypothetical protein
MGVQQSYQWTPHADERWKQRSLPGEDRDVLLEQASPKKGKPVLLDKGPFEDSYFQPFHRPVCLTHDNGWAFVVDHKSNIVTCYHLHRGPKPCPNTKEATIPPSDEPVHGRSVH